MNRRVQVLVVVDDVPDHVTDKQVEKVIYGTVVNDDGMKVGHVGFVAIPLDTRQLIVQMAAREIKQQVEAGLCVGASEPHRMAGDALLDLILDEVAK